MKVDFRATFLLGLGTNVQGCTRMHGWHLVLMAAEEVMVDKEACILTENLAKVARKFYHSCPMYFGTNHVEAKLSFMKIG